MAYNASTNYQQLIDGAVKRGDMASAAKYEQQRNEKIAGTGSGQKQTSLYAGYLSQGDQGTGYARAAGQQSRQQIQDVLGRAVGAGADGAGEYRDANGNKTTYRPEFAGQTVRLGSQYVTYDQNGYPVTGASVSHANNLGREYTKQNLGFDPDETADAADVYQALYNLALGGTSVSGSGFNNAYGLKNIQYDRTKTLEDYDALIRQAAASGNSVLAGYYEDSRNALIADRGLDPNLQSARYNGGWNYMDNGGGVGDYTGKLDPTQEELNLGGGWWQEQDRGDAGANAQWYQNNSFPTMSEVMSYGKALGYDMENGDVAMTPLVRQMIENGYVSPEALRRASTLSRTVPAALRNLGIEAEGTGTDALETTIRTMQQRRGQNSNEYAQALAAAAQAYGTPYGSGGNGYTGGSGGSLEDQLMGLYGENGGYAKALEQLRDMVDASTQQATNGYNAQKEQVNQSYADVFRQLYIDRERNRKNIGQQMAASGVTGGASESTLLGLNTDYEEALRQGEQGRINDLSELEQAIVNAQLSGDMEYAQLAMQLYQQQVDNYAGVLQSVAKKLASGETGQSVVKALIGSAGEGLEEVVSGLLSPALEAIYNGKSAGENYSELEAAELLYEGAVGALLGGVGGTVNVAQTARDIRSQKRAEKPKNLKTAEEQRQGAQDEPRYLKRAEERTTQEPVQEEPRYLKTAEEMAAEPTLEELMAGGRATPEQQEAFIRKYGEETFNRLATENMQNGRIDGEGNDLVWKAEEPRYLQRAEEPAQQLQAEEPRYLRTAEEQTAQEMQEPRYLKTAEEMTLEEPGVHGDTAWMSREDADYLSQLAKAARASIEVVDTLGDAQGTYDPKTGRIRIAKDATDPVGFVTQHELTHRIRDNAPQQWGQFLDYVQKHYGEDWNGVLEGYQRRYAEHDIELTAEEAAEEAAADFAGRMNESDIRRLTQENRSLAQKILDAIRDLIRKLKGGENQKLYEMEKLWAGALKEGNKNTANEGGVRYSISEIEGEKKKYGTGVILDTNLFDGAKPRGWGRILGDYVYKNLAGKELTVYDEDGKPETVHLARLNDRVKKDGAKSSHKVIDKLARYNGDNTRALATVHLAEALETSRNETSTDEHNHQWMDENGWTLRKAYLQDRSGNIYEATLNIADGRDRKILYDINNIKLVDKAKKGTADGDVPSTENGRGSHINSSSKGMVPETSAKSNPQNAKKTKKSLKSDSRGRALTAAQQEYFADSQVLDKSGKLLPVYHTTYDEFHTFDRNRLGAVTDGNASDKTMAATAHIGFWFNTQDLRKAYGSGSRAEEVYLNITNPLKLNSLDELYNYVSLYGGDGSAAEMGEATAEALRDYGYDGIALRDEEFGGTSYVALEPEQIKRVTNESPTSDPDMRRSLKGSKEAAEEIEREAGRKRRLQAAEGGEIKPGAETRKAFNEVRKARRAAERAERINRLTDAEKETVDKLLKGEISESGDEVNQHVLAAYRAKKVYEDYAGEIREYREKHRGTLREKADQELGDLTAWKDKKAGLLYSRETMERNIRDIAPDKETAKRIVEKYFTPVHESEAKATRMKNEYRDRVRKLGLSRKAAKGNKVSEAAAVQILGEAEGAIQSLENAKEGARRDGKTLKEWRGIVEDLWRENPALDQRKIGGAVEEFRGLYDELIQQINEVRVRNGYEPVEYRKGYFPHFKNGEADGALKVLGKVLGIETEVTQLPTSINGLTHTFKPGIRWFGNALERTGYDTVYDAVEGFDRYIEGAAGVVTQTDNIQNLRALANQIRWRSTDEGIRAEMERIQGNDALDEGQKQELLQRLFDNGRYALSNFVAELDEYTNLLANKKSRGDRSMKAKLGRNAYTLMKNLEGRVAANMVAVNPASWLTNLVPLTQGFATVDTGNMFRGMWDTMRAYKEDDGFAGKSSFLTNRRGSDPLVKTWAQNASAKLSKPMEYIDTFTADSLVRARYLQNKEGGLSDAEAMREADAWAAGVMADRSKGATPTIFSEKNPITKLFTQFQLEVNNQLSWLLKDLPDDEKEKGAAAIAAALLKFFVGSFLYNELYEYVIGRRPALDPLGMLNDTVGDLTGRELPNLTDAVVKAAKGEGFKLKQSEPQGAYGAVTGIAENVAENLPFVGGILGGGRIPISSALPDFENLAKAVAYDGWSDEKRAATLAKELSAPATYLVLPFGGGQLKRIYQSIKAVEEGGSYSMDKDGNPLMQYPVYNDTGKQRAGALAKSVVFGKSSLKTAQEWVESGFDSFNAKETATYQGMNEAGVSDEDAYALIREMGNAKKTKTMSASTWKRRILQNADISEAGKSVAYYGLLANDKERELMDELEGSENMGAVTEALMELKDAGLLSGKRANDKRMTALMDNRLSNRGKLKIYQEMISDDTEDLEDALSVGVSFDDFLQFKEDVYGLASDGTGTKKEKVMDVIDEMGLTKEQKDELYFAAGYKEKTLWKDAPWRNGTSRARYLPGP